MLFTRLIEVGRRCSILRPQREVAVKSMRSALRFRQLRRSGAPVRSPSPRKHVDSISHPRVSYVSTQYTLLFSSSTITSATATINTRLLDHKRNSELVLELLVKLGQVFLGRLLSRPANDKTLLVRGGWLGDNMEMDMVNFLYKHVRLLTSDGDN